MPRRSLNNEIVGKLPFIGKNYIRAVYLEGRDAARRGDAVVRDRSIRALGAYTLGHHLQVVVGLFSGAMHALHAVKYSGGGVDIAQAAYDAAYAGMNGMVTPAQHRLTRQLEEMPIETVDPALETSEGAPIYDKTPSNLDRATTIGVQCAFLGTLATALPEQYQMSADFFSN